MQSQSQGQGGGNGDRPFEREAGPEPRWSSFEEPRTVGDHPQSSFTDDAPAHGFSADRRDQIAHGLHASDHEPLPPAADWRDPALAEDEAYRLDQTREVDAPLLGETAHDAPSAAPWLEPAGDEPVEGASGGRLIGLVVAGLALIGLVVGGLYAWQNRAVEGDGTLIAAPAGPYKGPPAPERGRFEGEADAAVAATEGQAPTGNVDASRLPEAPTNPTPVRIAQAERPATMPAPKGAAAAAPVTRADAVPASAPTPVSKAAPAPTAAPAAGTAQLGAFANQAAANRAWSQLQSRFEWLKDTGHSVTPATVNGRTVYRLTAAGGATLCQRLRVAGETCIVR